jgi:hypothetical protein
LTTTDLQYLIDDTQEAVRTRLTVTWARLATIEQPDTDTAEREDYDRIVTSLNFVQNDGSLGVHNYAYVDAVLDSAERTLTELSVPGAVLVPTEAPAPTAIPAESSSPSPSSSVTVSSGLRPMTVLLIGIISLILVIAGVAFFRRPDDREAGT